MPKLEPSFRDLAQDRKKTRVVFQHEEDDDMLRPEGATLLKPPTLDEPMSPLSRKSEEPISSRPRRVSSSRRGSTMTSATSHDERARERINDLETEVARHKALLDRISTEHQSFIRGGAAARLEATVMRQRLCAVNDVMHEKNRKLVALEQRNANRLRHACAKETVVTDLEAENARLKAALVETAEATQQCVSRLSDASQMLSGLRKWSHVCSALSDVGTRLRGVVDGARAMLEQDHYEEEPREGDESAAAAEVAMEALQRLRKDLCSDATKSTTRVACIVNTAAVKFMRSKLAAQRDHMIALERCAFKQKCSGMRRLTQHVEQATMAAEDHASLLVQTCHAPATMVARSTQTEQSQQHGSAQNLAPQTTFSVLRDSFGGFRR